MKGAMRFDEILKYLGEFGTYQKRLYFLLCIPLIFAAFHKLVWVFLGAVPDHRCRLSEDDVYGNTSILLRTSSHHLNATIPWDDLHERWDRCKMYVDVTNSTDGGYNATFGSVRTTRTCDSWVYDHSQYHSTVVTDFNLVCHQNWLRALAYTLYIVGEFLGAIVIGSLSDRIGRRKVLILCLVGEGITGVMVGLIHNYYAFIVLRMFLGMFTQAELLTGYVLALEFVGPSKRVFAGIACNYFFAIGFVITAGVAYLIRDWNYLQISMSMPIVLFCVCIKWIPESARWLLSVNKPQEAMTIIQKAAKVNNVILPPAAIETEPKEKADILPQAGPLDLVQNPAVRNIVLVMGYAWFVNSAVYYGLSLNTSNLGGNDYRNFLISAVIEFPAYTATLVSLSWYGRRMPTFLSMALGGTGLMAIIFVPSHMTAVVITLAMVGKFGITMSYAIVFVFAAELIPTQVRNAAMGVNSTCARIGGMVTPFILLLADYWKPLPLIVLGAMSVSAGLLALLLPETHGKQLPETILDVGKITRRKKSKAGIVNGKPIQIVVTEAEVDDNEPEAEMKPMMNSLKVRIANQSDEIKI